MGGIVKKVIIRVGIGGDVGEEARNGGEDEKERDGADGEDREKVALR